MRACVCARARVCVCALLADLSVHVSVCLPACRWISDAITNTHTRALLALPAGEKRKGGGGRTIMGWGGSESGDRAQGPRKKRADE